MIYQFELVDYFTKILSPLQVLWEDGAGSQQPCRQLPTEQTWSLLALQGVLLVWKEWSGDTIQTNE